MYACMYMYVKRHCQRIWMNVKVDLQQRNVQDILQVLCQCVTCVLKLFTVVCGHGWRRGNRLRREKGMLTSSSLIFGSSENRHKTELVSFLSGKSFEIFGIYLFLLHGPNLNQAKEDCETEVLVIQFAASNLQGIHLEVWVIPQFPHESTLVETAKPNSTVNIVCQHCLKFVK